MNTEKKIALNNLWICSVLVLSLTAGCKAKTITVPVTIVKPVVTTVTVAGSAKTTPTTTPKLNSLTVNLSVVAPNDYAAYVLR